MAVTHLGRRFIQHPHELYRQLREEGPVSEVVVWGGARAWLVTRYAEARQLLNDPRLRKDYYRVAELLPPDLSGSHTNPMYAHMLNSDPPDHTRLRRLVSNAFTAKTVAGLRPKIGSKVRSPSAVCCSAFPDCAWTQPGPSPTTASAH